MEQCGSLSMSLDLTVEQAAAPGDTKREIQAKMLFGDTEIKASAKDVRTSQTVRVAVDFMNESNPKYMTKL